MRQYSRIRRQYERAIRSIGMSLANRHESMCWSLVLKSTQSLSKISTPTVSLAPTRSGFGNHQLPSGLKCSLQRYGRFCNRFVVSVNERDGRSHRAAQGATVNGDDL